MASFKLVQNDTGPSIQVYLTDDETGLPIDVSNANDIVTMYFQKYGETDPKASLVGSKPNGGTDGLVQFDWTDGDLDESGEFEGEIEIAFASGKTQTMYDKLSFTVREEIGP